MTLQKQHFETDRMIARCQLTLILFACAALPSISNAQKNPLKNGANRPQATKNRETISKVKLEREANIVQTFNSGPVASVDLGKLNSSTIIKLTVRVTNLTSQTLRFDRVASACSCSEMTPQKGEIAPNETISMKMTVNTYDRPSQLRGTGLFDFQYRNASQFTMDFSYEISGYAGLPASLIMIETEPENTELDLAFVAPIIITDDMGFDELTISVGEIPGDFTYTIDRAQQKIMGRLKTSMPLGKDKTYARLRLKDLRRSNESVASIIIERRALIGVYPSTLRFSATKTGDSFSTICYVRPDSSIVDDMKNLSVAAEDPNDTLAITTEVFKLSDALYKVILTARPKIAETEQRRDAQDNNTDPPERSVNIKLVYADDFVSKSLPFVLQE